VSEMPPFLGDFSDDDVAWMKANGVQREVRAARPIIEEGILPDDLFWVLKGNFLVSSKKVTMPLRVTLGPGEIVGEMSYITRQPPRGSVHALVDSVVLAIPRARLDRKIEQDTGFAARFHRVVSEFTITRLNGGRPGNGFGAPPEPADHAALRRVYDLIERMLRGDL
jgi:CRP/FNR family cyclic AMP-dependent transcriptional regulator